MSNKYLEQQIKHQKEIEKLQERIIYFTAMSSIIGCTIGAVCGYMIGIENAQKIATQEMPAIKQVSEKQRQY